ncbi:hypothetical protein B194_1890 [Serratia plymuthica A30]|nr:hypothetical protein B194_1890 [Serratia plymuthica A30]
MVIGVLTRRLSFVGYSAGVQWINQYPGIRSATGRGQNK